MKSNKPVSDLDDQALFQEWLGVMDDSLEYFITMLPPEVGRRLDYTPESLDVLEGWVLDRYAGVDAIMAESELLDLEYMARYVGETVRRSIGGEWRIAYDDPKAAHYGVPEIRFAEKVPPLAPKYLVTASVDRRTGQYLRMVVTNTGQMIERKRQAS